MSQKARKEQRSCALFERIGVNSLDCDSFAKKALYCCDKSDKGLGGFSFGSEFAGIGSHIALEDGKKYLIRWVKVHFGFVYRFGLEMV
ncbi:MAG: hypothetical protein HQL32_03080 [Planctomycetes bacterium]|nr:hypothetical protein [Planctomycetota bacterium]